jgi:hypothetical protein
VVGLDGSDVGVDEDRSNAGFLEGLEGLSTYISIVLILNVQK